MDKSYLIQSAGLLKQVSQSALLEFQMNTNKILGIMNQRMQQRKDLDALIGKDNLQMMFDNHANHLRFMSSMFKNYNANVMVETILWVFGAYQSHGFQSNYWAAQLNTWIEVLKSELTPGTFNEIYPFYEWMQVNIPHFTSLSNNSQNPNQPMH
ncbi:MAG: hypothetical protein CVU09_08955 [Bacteroidetes bacterium HGW-Bacteroidetes-4]|jgi:hypothetical protein|nr:MAG: hypothetical protein CVU09_08955 [Bacteroidetes bacterium HGW-Bacteroidetes-4]